MKEIGLDALRKIDGDFNLYLQWFYFISFSDNKQIISKDFIPCVRAKTSDASCESTTLVKKSQLFNFITCKGNLHIRVIRLYIIELYNC